MVKPTSYIPTNPINTTFGTARTRASKKSFGSQKGGIRNTDTCPRGNDLTSRRRVAPIGGVADRSPSRRATHCHVLGLKIRASFRTKGWRGNLGAECKIYNHVWHIGIGIGPIAQLSVSVAPKAPDCPIARHDNTINASTHRDHSCKINHDYWSGAVGIGPITKLALRVVTPGHHRPIHLHCQRMILARSYRYRIAHPNRSHHHKAVVRRAVTKLPVVVVTRIPHRPIGL